MTTDVLPNAEPQAVAPPAVEPPVQAVAPGETEAPKERESAPVSSEESAADDQLPAEASAPPAVVALSNKRWYVVKVQSGREDSIKDAIERRVKIERLEEFFGQIIIPVEKV